MASWIGVLCVDGPALGGSRLVLGLSLIMGCVEPPDRPGGDGGGPRGLDEPTTSGTGTTGLTTASDPDVWTRVGEVSVYEAASDQHHVTHDRAPDGTIGVVFDDQPPGDHQVLFRVFAPDLVALDPPQVVVPNFGGSTARPDVAYAEPGWTIGWNTQYDVMVSRRDLTGAPLVDAVVVNVVRGVDGYKGQPDLAALGGGSVVVVYELSDPAMSPVTTYFQRRVDAALEPLSDEVVVAGSPEVGSPPAASAMPDDGWVLAWSDRQQQGGSVWLTWADAEGVPIDEVTVSTNVVGPAPSRPSVSADDAGRTVVAWRVQDDDGVGIGAWARFYGDGRQPLSDPILLDANGNYANVAAVDGVAVFTWVDDATREVRAWAWDIATQTPIGEILTPSARPLPQTRPLASILPGGDGTWDVVISLEAGRAGERKGALTRYTLRP